MSQYDSKKRRFAVEYRWQRDDSIFRSICLPFVTISLVQHRFNPFERTNDWILKDFSYQLEQVETLSRSCALSMGCALFSQTYKRKIYVKIRTKRSFIRALSTPIAQQRSAILSSYIFLRYGGIKADTFAWPSFSLWTKKVPVVMSEFSTPRRKEANVIDTRMLRFISLSGLHLDFHGATENVSFLLWITTLKLTDYNLSYNEYAIHFKYDMYSHFYFNISSFIFFIKKINNGEFVA